MGSSNLGRLNPCFQLRFVQDKTARTCIEALAQRDGAITNESSRHNQERRA